MKSPALKRVGLFILSDGKENSKCQTEFIEVCLEHKLAVLVSLIIGINLIQVLGS